MRAEIATLPPKKVKSKWSMNHGPTGNRWKNKWLLLSCSRCDFFFCQCVKCLIWITSVSMRSQLLGFLFCLLDLTLHQCQLLTYKQDLGGTLSVVGSPGCQMFQVCGQAFRIVVPNCLFICACGPKSKHSWVSTIHSLLSLSWIELSYFMMDCKLAVWLIEIVGCWK